MASQRRRRILIAALADRARREIGPAATPLDYVCAYLAGHGTIARLARSLQDELRVSISRSFLAFCAHRLERAATPRIQAARASRGTTYARGYPQVRSLDASGAGRLRTGDTQPPATGRAEPAVLNAGRDAAITVRPQTVAKQIAEPPNS